MLPGAQRENAVPVSRHTDDSTDTGEPVMVNGGGLTFTATSMHSEAMLEAAPR
jgi:hypothetical protein